MDDNRDPTYTPFGRSQAPRAREPGEIVWTLRRDHVDWSCELLFRGESYGWEVRVLRSSELSISRRFILREPAVRWADEQRTDIERGWIDE